MNFCHSGDSLLGYLIVALTLLVGQPAQCQSPVLVPQIVNSGGEASSSGDYTLISSVGGIDGMGMSADCVVQSGFQAQLAVPGPVLSPYQNWKLLHFGSLVAGDLASPAGDGIPNLLKYALNGNPSANDSNSDVLPQVSVGEPGRLRMTFKRYLDRTDLIITVQISDSPAGPWESIARSEAAAPMSGIILPSAVTEHAGDNANQVVVSVSYPLPDPLHHRRFIRLHVQYGAGGM